MLGKDLSEALGGVAEDKIEAAANVATKSRRHIWVRVAACAAVLAILLTTLLWPGQPKTENGQIVAMPGVLKAYACAVEENAHPEQLKDYELTQGAVNLATNVWNPQCSIVTGIPVLLWIQEPELSEHEITFQLRTNYGELYDRTYVSRDVFHDPNAMVVNKDAFLGKQTTLHNKALFYWEGYELLDMCEGRTIGDVMDEIGPVYVEVIIRADEAIIGYAVFEMYSMDDKEPAFMVRLKANTFYPKVDGQFQNVTEDYVCKAMEESKHKKGWMVEGGVFCAARHPSEAYWVFTSGVSMSVRYACMVVDEDYAGKNITFDLSTNYGGFYSDDGKPLGKSVTLNNRMYFKWKGSPGMEYDLTVYVDVIIRADGNVIGYGTIKIERLWEELHTYGTKFCKTVCLPMGNGEYPQLTEEDARLEIEKIKAG